MKTHAVILLGEKCSGKSELLKRLIQDGVYNADYHPTIGADFKKKFIDGKNSLAIWDLSGDERYSDLLSSYYNNANVALLCVDLSKNINKEQIQKKIERFSLVNNGPVILVGTKSDHSEAQTHIQEFNQLDLGKKTFITSAKDEFQISELLDGIAQACNIKSLKEQKEQWDEAVKNLSLLINHLPYEMADAIDQELNQLKKIMLPTAFSDETDNELRQRTIEQFQKNCQAILNGGYTNVWKAILMVVATTVVTVIATMLGFAIGFALGAWTGPGAFITALAGANATAVSVVGASTTLGVGAAALTAYGVFKKPKEMDEIDEFVIDLNGLY